MSTPSIKIYFITDHDKKLSKREHKIPNYSIHISRSGRCCSLLNLSRYIISSAISNWRWKPRPTSIPSCKIVITILRVKISTNMSGPLTGPSLPWPGCIVMRTELLVWWPGEKVDDDPEDDKCCSTKQSPLPSLYASGSSRRF